MSRRKLPPLPKTAWTQLGEIPVKLVPDLMPPNKPANADGLILFGYAGYTQRTLEIRAGMDERTTWQTYFHERMHFWLFDAGVQLTAEQTESVCDSVATAMVASMLSGKTVSEKRPRISDTPKKTGRQRKGA